LLKKYTLIYKILLKTNVISWVINGILVESGWNTLPSEENFDIKTPGSNDFKLRTGKLLYKHGPSLSKSADESFV